MLVKIEQEGGVKSIKIAEASDGLNAYQLAVKNDGFVGDYDAWKVTLKGDKGDPGNDANVTSGNIATALGYTPADDAKLASLGTNWYVDGVSGSDSNSGITPTQAFKTFAGLSGVAENQTINLKRGSYFRERLAIPNNAHNVTIQPYGSTSQALPVIDCSDVVSSWTKTTNQTNVYESNVIIDISSTIYVNVWEDDAFLVRATSVANCDATPGSYYPSTELSSPITLYIHPKASTNPISDGKVYEYSKRLNAIDSDGEDYITINGVVTKKNLDHNGSIITGKYATLYDVECLQGNKHNILTREGARLYRVKADKAYFGSSSTSNFVTYQTTAAGKYVYYEDCIASRDAPNSLGSGFLMHDSSGGTGSFGEVTFRRCKAINTATGFNTGALDKHFEVDCYANVTGKSSSSSAEIIIYGADYTSSSNSSLFEINNAGGIIRIFDAVNLKINTGAGRILLSSSDNIIFEMRNSIVTSSAGWMIQSYGGLNQNYFLYRNEYKAVGFGHIRLANSANIKSDFNIYGEPLKDYEIAGVVYNTVKEWVDATGNDLNSAYGELFVTGSGTNNYLPKFSTNGKTLGNSAVYNNANGISIGGDTTSPYSFTLKSTGTDKNNGICLYNDLSEDASGGRFLLNTYSGFGVEALIIQEYSNTNAFKKNILTLRKGTGNIGIDETSPSEKLHVKGNGKFTGNVITISPTADTHAATKKYVDDKVVGATGTFTTVDSKTVTVTNGLITSIV